VRLVALSRRWYLVSFDLHRTDGGPSESTASPDLAPPGSRTYLAEARAAMAPVVRGDVILNLSPADTMTRIRDSLGDSRIDAAADGRTRWRTDADTVPLLASQILHLGCEFEVCGPPELSGYLRELADHATFRTRRPQRGRAPRVIRVVPPVARSTPHDALVAAGVLHRGYSFWRGLPPGL
jgi:hypothetical protein